MQSEITASECTMKSSANHMQEEVISELHGQLAGLVCSITGYKTAVQRYHLLSPDLVKVGKNYYRY